MNRQLFNAMAAQYAAPEVSGSGLVCWEGGKKCVIPSVKLYGTAAQDGTPSPDAPVLPVCNNGEVKANGRNLLDMKKAQPLHDTYGLSMTITDDGGIRMTGTSTFEGTASFRIAYIDAVYETLMQIGAQIVGFDMPGNSILQFDLIYKTIVIGSWYIHEGAYYDVTVYPMCYVGERPANYAPYYDGGQTRAPELWGIPGTEYRDEWNCQTGRGIRRCAVIDSYAGEPVDTPYISSTGALTKGAIIVYGIPDMPFTTAPAKLTMPTGYGQIIQIGGNVANCPVTAKYLRHR